MANNKAVNDPLEDIDPVMAEAFSVKEEKKASEPKKPVEKKKNKAGPKSDSAPDAVTPSAPTISQVEFPDLSKEVAGAGLDTEMFNNIPVKITVELGRAKLSLKELYELSEGAIVELQRLVGEPLDLLVNDQLIAQGEVVAIDNNYGIRLTHIVAKAD